MELPEHGVPVLDVWPEVAAGRLAVLACESTGTGHLAVQDAAAATYDDGTWDGPPLRWFERDAKKSIVTRGVTATSATRPVPVGAPACGGPDERPARLYGAGTCRACDDFMLWVMSRVSNSWRGVAQSQSGSGDGRQDPFKLVMLVDGQPQPMDVGVVPASMLPLLRPAVEGAQFGEQFMVVAVARGRVRHIAQTRLTVTYDDERYTAVFETPYTLCGKAALADGDPTGMSDCKTCAGRFRSRLYRADQADRGVALDGTYATRDVFRMFGQEGVTALLGFDQAPDLDRWQEFSY